MSLPNVHVQVMPDAEKGIDDTGTVKIESSSSSYLVVPDGIEPHSGVVVVDETFGLNEQHPRHLRAVRRAGIRGPRVDLFDGRTGSCVSARMFIGAMVRKLD